MIYAIIILSGFLSALILLVWFRKVQFDAVHRNWLDLEDKYGGKIIRSGFAVRPRYNGKIGENALSISISAEKRVKDKPRQYYLSVFLKKSSEVNFTVLSTEWIKDRKQNKAVELKSRKIANDKYVIEVKDGELLKKLPVKEIEKLTQEIDPVAYALVSKNGILTERISSNLIADTEFEKINPLIEGIDKLADLKLL